MFFFLSKFLPLFLYPVGFVTLLILVSLFLYRRRSWQTAVLVVGFLTLFLGGNRWVSLALARNLEWQYLPPEPLPQADVIVVLGGSTQSVDYPQPVVNLNEAGDRLLYAAWLYQQGVAEQLLLVGGRLPGTTEQEAVDMAAVLEMMGVPRERLWLETKSLNTYENGLYAKEFLAEEGIERIVLVTSAIHMPRSVAVFEKQGFEVVPAPTDYNSVRPEWDAGEAPSPGSQLLYLMPSVESLQLTTRVMKESLGILIYGWRGWL